MSKLKDDARWLVDQITASNAAVKALSKPQLGTSSIESGAIEEYDTEGTLVSVTGGQFDGTHASVTMAGPVPSEPVAPSVSVGVGQVEVRWSGKFLDDAASPMDFSHVSVHVSDLEIFEPDNDTQKATITGESGDVATVMLSPGEWSVLLVAVSKAGKWSDPSDAVAVEVADTLTSDQILDEILKVDQSISDVQVSVNGKNRIHNSIADATGTDFVEGDRWQKWTTLEPGGKLTRSWRFTAGVWVAEALDASYLPLVDIGQGTFGEFDGQRLKAKSITSGSLSADAIDGKTIIGAVIQTVATANRGVKITSAGLKSYNSTGEVVLDIPTDGSLNRIVGRLSTAPTGKSGIVLTNETTSGGGGGIWFTEDGGLGGEQAAIYIDSNWSLRLRGKLTASAQIVPVRVERGMQFMDNSAIQGPGWYIGSGGIFSVTEMRAGEMYLNDPPTSTFAANVGIASNPKDRLYKLSSARRYKYAIETVADADRLLSIDPRSWFDAGATDSYAKYVEGDDIALEDIPQLTRVPGVVAEEVEAAGLGMYCTYDHEGRIQGVSYDRLWTLLIPLVKDSRDRIAELESIIKESS